MFYTILYFIFLSTSILFISCNNKENKSIDLVKDIEFNTAVGSDMPDLYFEHQLKEELIYFIDKVREKNIKFFNKKGKLIKITPLNDAIKGIDNIGRITVISFDTIIINSNYTNQILIIDQLGRIWKNYSLTNNLIDSLGNQYELFSSIYPIVQSPNSLLYAISWRSNFKDIEEHKVPDSNFDYLKYSNKKSSESYFFITINNIITSKEPNLTFKYPNFYKNLHDNNSFFLELPLYFIFNNHIFINSFYSDKIFILNKKDFELEKVIRISSKYTKIGTNPIKINKNIIGKIQDSITYKQKTCGKIEKILFNKFKSEFYVIIRHSSSTKDFDRKKVAFSIIVLDENMVMKSEYKFDDFNYKYYYTLLSSEGLLLLKNDTTKKIIKDEKVVYSLCNFD